MSERRPGGVLQSMGAVIAGMLVVAGPSIATDHLLRALRVYPPSDTRMSDGLFLLATAYRILYTIAGAFVAARLAPRRPMRHALALGGLGLALSIAGAFAAQDGSAELGPSWYSVAIVAIALPCAWAGGMLRIHQLRRGSLTASGPRATT
jgi:hypothetical protein